MSEVIDYAVIGGGIAGVYSAWRLKQELPDKNIQLFEYSDRIGGKLMTVQLPDMPDVNAELGGMRIIPSEQKLMMSLAEAMGLDLVPFPMGSKEDPTGADNLAYFRDTHMKVGQLGDRTHSPYELAWNERGYGPNQLQSQVMKLLVPEWKGLGPDDWFEVEVLGRPLWEWGFWNLLYEVLSPEGYAFIRECCGYDTNVCNGNAVNLLPTGGEYDGSAAYETPIKGMQAIPVAVAEAFRQMQGPIHMNQCLDSIRRREDGLYDLAFTRTRSRNGHTHRLWEGDDLHSTYRAEHVILALPRVALEAVQWDQWQRSRFLRENLRSVLVQDAFKLVLGYEYAWWRSLGLVAGRSLSDLPIRQTLYFGQQHPPGDPLKKEEESGQTDSYPREKALLMASYNDITTVPFWKGLERGEPFGTEPADHLASRNMVLAAHRQVEELHGQKGLPQPFAAAFRDWSEFPFGGAWHSWKAGFKYNDICRRMTHPVKSEKVYICGEAYSQDQGWAEGALETAEAMLTGNLGLGRHRAIDHRSHAMRRLRY